MDWTMVSYVGIMSVTPGPNNLLLATSGVNFGLRRTIPHVLGISLGMFVLVFATVLLLGSILSIFSGLRPWLALGGGGYLLWLSWHIFRAGKPGEAKGATKPFTPWEAALFQVLNPKAWVMVVNMALFFAPGKGGDWWAAFALAAVSTAINLPCISIWAVLGDRLRKLLSGDRAGFAFNTIMALLMAGTALVLMAEEWLPAT